MKNIFNLQLFAVNVTTDSGLTAEMKTFYDMTLIDEAGPNLIHDQFGQKRDIPQGSGKIIEFRKFAPLAKATTALTEGTTPAGKALSVTAITAEVAQYGDFITQSDVLELTALDNTILEATKLLGRQAGLTLDTITRNVIIAGTNVSYASKWANGVETVVTARNALNDTAVLKVDTINQCVAKLRAANAPTFKDGHYVGIIHPYAAYELMRDPEWIDAHKYAVPENIYEGEIGMIGGVRFVQTTEAKVFGAASADSHAVFATLIIGEGAYGTTNVTGGGLQTIVKNKGSAGTADPLDQRSSVGWKAIKTAKILVQDYMVRVESCSPRFASTATN